MARVRRLGASFWSLVVSGAVAFVLSMAISLRPDWIEAVLGADPDAGDGVLEQLLTIGSALVFLVCAAAALRAWRRPLARA